MIDILLLIVIGGSALLGLIRGLVGTLVSTAAWLLAGWVAFQFGEQTAFWLSDDGKPTMTELFGGYTLSFVAVMVAVTLVGALAKSMVHSVGLSGVDHALGAALGLLRGAFLACLLVLLMGFTPLPREPAWQQSSVLPLLVPVAQWMRSRLPDWSVPAMDFRNTLPAGDNDRVEGLSKPLLEGVLQQAIDARNGAASREAEGRLPAVEDPANIEAGGQDPANIETPGQDSASADPAGTQSKQRPTGQKRPDSQ
jgi:membrane protein required for colicin V production